MESFFIFYLFILHYYFDYFYYFLECYGEFSRRSLFFFKYFTFLFCKFHCLKINLYFNLEKVAFFTKMFVCIDFKVENCFNRIWICNSNYQNISLLFFFDKMAKMSPINIIYNSNDDNITCLALLTLT